MGWLQNILDADKELFLYLNSFHNDFWDTVMLLVTRKETWIPFYLILVWFFIKNYKSKALILLFFVALTVVVSDQFSVLFKDIFQRLRPVHEPEIASQVHNVLRKGGMYGFVSSHAANSFAIFIFTYKVFKNQSYGILAFLWAALFSYSRIYSGVHYPLDILGGALLGLLVGFLLYKLMMFVENHFFIVRPPRIEKTKLPAEQSAVVYLVFAVLFITVITVSSLLHYYNYL